MKNKVLKALMAVALIITLTMADFILFGVNLVTYALEDGADATNHDDVKFAAYFKAGEEEVSQVEYEMNNTEMMLYMKVSVKNGYFDGVITLEDSNFKLKQDKLSEGISKIEGNTITLNRVRAGKTVEIAVRIEPIIEEIYAENMLNKESTLRLTGDYKDDTEENITIEAEKKVTLSLLAPSNIEATLEGKVITNRIYKIEEVDKRIVQIELNSAVVENAYPIKETIFELALPEGVEDIEVISKGTYATNGEADRKLEETSYEHDTENNTLQVTIENTSKDGNISWKKDALDNIIVTLILAEDAEIETEEYSVKSKVEFQGEEGKILEKEVKYNLSKEADGIIRTSIENEEEIYKGKIYSKEEREYNSTTNIEVNYANLIERSSLEEKIVYKTETEDKQANVQYKTTKISKAEIEKVLGAEETLIIKSGSVEIAKITADTEANEEGNIVITYNDGVKELQVEITKAVETGIIRLNHTKAIKAEEYSKEEITEIKNLVEQATVKYVTIENTFDKMTQLKETETVAELVVDPQTLSTASKNEDVKFAITLKADSEKYDLYKNPMFTIKLPEGITNVSNIETVLLYLDNFTSETGYNSETREITIRLNGEQTQYNGINTNGYIEITADIELDEKTPNKQDTISLTYTNEKAETYKNDGKINVPMSVAGYGGLVAFNSITNYGVKTNSANSKEEQIENLKTHQEQAEANSQIALLNNTGSDLENVKVLGNLPVQGNITVGEYTFENTIAATLKSGIAIESGAATIYYTGNRNATNELGDAANGWSSNLAQVTNPVLYMIVISNMDEGTNFIANYTMNIPENLQHNKDMRTTYVVDYSTDISNEIVNATPVGFSTGKILVTLDAAVGTDKLENGATVKAGEVIRYKVSVTNEGTSNVENVKVSGLVPDGTVYVEPMEDFEYVEPNSLYYEEDENKKNVEKIIEELKANETVTYEYEVRVKSDVTTGSMYNEATVTYNEDVEIVSNRIFINLARGDIRVTVKRATNTEIILTSQKSVQYFIIVENISDTTIKNVEAKINVPNGIILRETEETDSTQAEIVDNNITITSIEPEESNVFLAYMKVEDILENVRDISIFITAERNGETYRSNVYNDKIYGYNLEMKMTATREEEYLEVGEIIEYNIEITNNSDIPTNSFTIEMEIPAQLTIKKIEQNGKEETISNTNYVSKILKIDAKNTTNIKITAVANYNPYEQEDETISTLAKIFYQGEEKNKDGTNSTLFEVGNRRTYYSR